MRCDLAGLLLIGLLFTTLPVAAQTPTTVSRPGPVPAGGVTGPRDRPRPVSGAARLSGIVIGGEGGAPLRRAFVRVSGVELPEGRATRTDEQGRWEIKDLPAGRYTLTASKAGYVALNYGQRRLSESGRPIEVADGQRVGNLNFNLPRGSVISGRVTDEFGEALSDVMVAPMRFRYINGRRRLIPAGRPASSDDGGNFRLYGLAPGEYYVSAKISDFDMSESDTQSGYAATYYPATANPQQADKITVGVGTETSGIVLSLLPVRTAKVSGTALDTRGRPMAGAFVSVIEGSGNSYMSFSGGNQVHDDGTFTVQNLAPGDYTLMVASEAPQGTREQASLPITVAGEDISGVALVAAKPSTITGRLMFDVPPPAGAVQPASFSVMAIPKDPSGMPMFFAFNGSNDRVADDWTFELKTVPGTVILQTSRLPPGYFLKSVFWRGEEITDTGIAVKPGVALSEIEVVVTRRNSTVAGTVIGADGRPTSEYVVIIFSEDKERWDYLSRGIAVGRPDQQGGFVVNPIPPGSYLAAALTEIEDGAEQDPDTLEKLQRVATPFRLEEGERKDLRLTLVEY